MPFDVAHAATTLTDAAPQDDAALMRALCAGQEAALREIARRHGGRVTRLAQRMLGSAAEADDVLQETLIRIWRNAARWDPERASLPTWIGTIAWRLCADRLRTPQARLAARHMQLDLDEAQFIASPEAGAEAALIRRQSLALVQRALESLPERQRAAFVLFHIEELSGQDAATTLGVGLRAFWSLLQRARNAVEDTVKRETRMAEPPPQTAPARPMPMAAGEKS